MSGEPFIFIGRTKWRELDRAFGMRPHDRRAHMYVVGKTGTGKSSLLEGMIRQDILAGNGLALFDHTATSQSASWRGSLSRGGQTSSTSTCPTRPNRSASIHLKASRRSGGRSRRTGSSRP